MKISTIIFDLGKVLVDYDILKFANAVLEKSDVTNEEIVLFVKSPLIRSYAMGKIETDVFLKEFKAAMRFEGTEEELERIWQDIFTPMDEHIQLAKQLAQYYPLAILSNTDDSHIRFLEPQYDFFSIFKEKIYSYREGYVKPQEEIYQIALERMNADRFETLFIDDLEENIIPPSKMGWQTIHLRPDVSLQQALQSYDLTGV